MSNIFLTFVPTKTNNNTMAKKTVKKNEFNDVPVPKPDFHNLTVDELYEELKTARKNGLGKKKIMLSNDDEGNGFHLMFYAVSPAKGFTWGLPHSVNEKNIDDDVILG